MFLVDVCLPLVKLKLKDFLNVYAFFSILTKPAPRLSRNIRVSVCLCLSDSPLAEGNTMPITPVKTTEFLYIYIIHYSKGHRPSADLR